MVKGFFYGGDSWARTSDPLRVEQVLYQLSYASDVFYYSIDVSA